MTKIDNFVDSTLKVIASEDLNIEKDLASENITNKSIEELLIEKDNEQTEQK